MSGSRRGGCGFCWFLVFLLFAGGKWTCANPSARPNPAHVTSLFERGLCTERVAASRPSAAVCCIERERAGRGKMGLCCYDEDSREVECR